MKSSRLSIYVRVAFFVVAAFCALNALTNEANTRQMILQGAGALEMPIRYPELVNSDSSDLHTESLSPITQAIMNINCGDLVSASIDNPAEVDLYSFSGQAGQIISLAVASTGGFASNQSSSSAELRLFAPSGSAVGGALRTNSQSNFTLPETGTYVFRVNAFNLSTTGSYNVNFECLTAASPVPTFLAITRIAPTSDADRISVTASLAVFPSGPALAGKSVRFTIDDINHPSFVEAATDNNGMATAELNLTDFSSLGPQSLTSTGVHTAFAIFDSDPAFEFSSAASDFTLGLPGMGCQFLISKADESFAANGGAGTINVTTFPQDCNWTAVSNDPWIQISFGTAGTGDGMVSYTVAPHIDPNAPRTGTITVAGLTFTVLQGAAYLDVPESHQFYTDIGKLSARGVTLGCGAGNYCPGQVVTRGQMAAFIIRALGDFNPPDPAMQRFNDVPPTNPFYSFIEQMALRQITLGCSVNPPLYCPTGPVTREQMAAFIIRAVGEPNPPVPITQRFGDVPPSNPFYNFIDRMAVRRITLGCSASPPLYCPAGTVTRAQMAAFLVRAFNL